MSKQISFYNSRNEKVFVTGIEIFENLTEKPNEVKSQHFYRAKVEYSYNNMIYGWEGDYNISLLLDANCEYLFEYLFESIKKDEIINEEISRQYQDEMNKSSD